MVVNILHVEGLLLIIFDLLCSVLCLKPLLGADTFIPEILNGIFFLTLITTPGGMFPTPGGMFLIYCLNVGLQQY